MTRSALAYLAVWAGAALAQTGVPSFVAPTMLHSDRLIPLISGEYFSIYGNNLGPSGSCGGSHDSQGAYPTLICDTQVLVNGIAAGLLYVQDRQINFQVPAGIPAEGTADVVVIYQGRSSKPVTIAAGPGKTTISLETPARVGMPVWLRVDNAYGDPEVRYPFMIFPAAFSCYEVEVRRDGKPLPRIADMESQAFQGIAYSGPACASVAFSTAPHFMGRLPLHLQYRFDQPGTYELRLTRRAGFLGTIPESKVVFTTPWTPIEILPADPSARRQWINQKVANAPSDPADLLTDFLPSILGNPDDETLRILLPYLYNPDLVVRDYSMYGLTYWPVEQAAAQVWAHVQDQGPSDVTIDFLHHAKQFMAGHADELVQAALPYLQSDSPMLVFGAVRAVSRIVLAKDSQISAELRARSVDALLNALDHAIHADPQNANEYISAVGAITSDRAHDLLWNVVNRRGSGLEQALIALTWLKYPADLPKLAQLILQAPSSDPRGPEFASIPYALHHAYGAAAIPYLEMLLERSTAVWVRTNSARELILAQRPQGFAFIADAITNHRSYRQEMIQFVRDQFPQLRQAQEGDILKFVQARAARN